LEYLSATDNVDGDVSDTISIGLSKVESANSFSIRTPGLYLVKCTAKDSSGNEGALYFPVILMASELRSYQGIWVGDDGSFLTIDTALFSGGNTKILDAKNYQKTIESSTFTYSLLDTGISVHQYSEQMNIDKTTVYSRKAEPHDYPHEAQNLLNEIKERALQSGLDDANCYISHASSYRGSNGFSVTVDSPKFSKLSKEEKLAAMINTSVPYLDGLESITSNGDIYERNGFTIYKNGIELYSGDKEELLKVGSKVQKKYGLEVENKSKYAKGMEMIERR